MTEVIGGKRPLWFWVVAWLALAWGLMGVAAYLGDVTMSEEALAAMPDAERALYETRPAWLIGLYAVAIFTALGGALALLLRRALALPLYLVSLAAVIVQFGYIFVAMNALAVVGAGGAVFPLVIFLIAAFLVWFSMQAKKKGWLR